jgi:ribonuclease HI
VLSSGAIVPRYSLLCFPPVDEFPRSRYISCIIVKVSQAQRIPTISLCSPRLLPISFKSLVLHVSSRCHGASQTPKVGRKVSTHSVSKRSHSLKHQFTWNMFLILLLYNIQEHSLRSMSEKHQERRSVHPYYKRIHVGSRSLPAITSSISQMFSKFSLWNHLRSIHNPPKMSPRKEKSPPVPPPLPAYPTSSNPRIFDFKAYHPAEIFPDSSDQSLSRDLTLFDNDTQVTNTLFYCRIPGDFNSPKIGEPREGEVVVFAAGTWHANGDANARAAYAAFFGPKSKFNACEFLPRTLNQTVQAAELYAVECAIKGFWELVLLEIKRAGKLVIVTHSDYVYDGLTKNVWKWEKKGYKTSRGKTVVDEALFKEIHASILALEGRKIRVEFWKVKKSANKDAIALVEGIFGTDLMGNNVVEEDDENESGRLILMHPVSHSAALTYWLNEAGKDPTAQALCDRAKIKIPLPPPSSTSFAASSASTSTSTTSSNPNPANLDCILGQLITLKLDTPENFSLLFGPQWEAGLKRILTRNQANFATEAPFFLQRE